MIAAHVHEPLSLGLGEKHLARLDHTFERLHPTPCGIAGHLPVAPDSVERRLEDRQHTIGTVLCASACLGVLIVGYHAVSPTPDLSRGEVSDEAFPERWQDMLLHPLFCVVGRRCGSLATQVLKIVLDGLAHGQIVFDSRLVSRGPPEPFSRLILRLIERQNPRAVGVQGVVGQAERLVLFPTVRHLTPCDPCTATAALAVAHRVAASDAGPVRLTALGEVCPGRPGVCLGGFDLAGHWLAPAVRTFYG